MEKHGRKKIYWQSTVVPALVTCVLCWSVSARAQTSGPEETPESEAAPAQTAPAEAAPVQAAPADAPPTEETSVERAKNTLYLELLGPGLIYSINYERGIADFNLRIGLGGASWGGSGYLQVPIGFNYIGLGNDVHHLELGATANITSVFYPGETVMAVTFSPIIGYRRQPVGGGFNFRAGLSPIIAGAGEGVTAIGFLPWPYVSFGVTL